MTKFTAFATVLVAALALAGADLADAKRLGGGGALGAQRRMAPAPSTPNATPSPSAPMQAAPAKPAAAPAAAAPSGASRWLGPLAGLAAGLGIGALLSHFGLSEGFGNLLILMLVVGGGFVLVRMLLARRTQPASPLRYAAAGPAAAPADRQEPYMTPPAAAFEPVFGGAPAQPAAATAGRFPPGFDPAPFAEQAKLQFRKLQAAYDVDDRKALADVMTPEMFADVSRDLAARGAHVPTEVVRLDAQVLEVTTEGDKHWMSVQFSGLLREDGTVLPKDFDEIWNLVKPVDGSSGWLLAGIQQAHEVA